LSASGSSAMAFCTAIEAAAKSHPAGRVSHRDACYGIDLEDVAYLEGMLRKQEEAGYDIGDGSLGGESERYPGDACRAKEG